MGLGRRGHLFVEGGLVGVLLWFSCCWIVSNCLLSGDVEGSSSSIYLS